MTDKMNFPSHSRYVPIGGLLAEWNQDQGRYILSVRNDEITWTSVGHAYAPEDAQRIVDGWGRD